MSIRSNRKIGQKLLGHHVPELRQSRFYQEDFKPVLDKTRDRRPIGHIICYGLGSFHCGTETASRYQLALLILMYERLCELKSPVSKVIELFDPSFEPADIEILKSFSGNLEFQIIPTNEYCARTVDTKHSSRATLVYMPHLDKYLYNNLLGANWNAHNLELLVILGNSFQAMIDFEIDSKHKTQLYYINLLVSNFGTRGHTIEASKSKTCDKKRDKIGEVAHDCEKAPSGVLIEHKIDTKDTDYWDIFNNFAFHFMDEIWLSDNKDKIDRYRIEGWECTIADGSDNE